MIEVFTIYFLMWVIFENFKKQDFFIKLLKNVKKYFFIGFFVDTVDCRGYT